MHHDALDTVALFQYSRGEGYVKFAENSRGASGLTYLQLVDQSVVENLERFDIEIKTG